GFDSIRGPYAGQSGGITAFGSKGHASMRGPMSSAAGRILRCGPAAHPLSPSASVDLAHLRPCRGRIGCAARNTSSEPEAEGELSHPPGRQSAERKPTRRDSLSHLFGIIGGFPMSPISRIQGTPPFTAAIVGDGAAICLSFGVIHLVVTST